VDCEKEYDSDNWEFYVNMLRRLGFCEIKACLYSSSISILVNGSPTLEFKPKKGLRQGNPLAHFLFNIVAEGLSGMMRQTIKKKLYTNSLVGKKKVEVN